MAEDVTVGRLELLGKRAFLRDIEIIQKEYLHRGISWALYGVSIFYPSTASFMSSHVCFGFGHTAFSTKVTYSTYCNGGWRYC
jgi:hypothetical protein